MQERRRQRQGCGGLLAGRPIVRRGQRGESRANRKTPRPDPGGPKSTLRFPHATGAAPKAELPQKLPVNSVTVCKPDGKPATPRRRRRVREQGGIPRDRDPSGGTRPNK